MDIEKDLCSICYDDIIRETKCTLLQCGHHFCIECVNISIKQSDEINKKYCCPLDNREIEAIQCFDPVLKAITTKNYHILVLEMFREWYNQKNQQLLKVIKGAMLSFIDIKNIFNNLLLKLSKFDKLLKNNKSEISIKSIMDLKEEISLFHKLDKYKMNIILFICKLKYYDSSFVSFYGEENVNEALLDMYNMWINFNQLVVYIRTISLIDDHIYNLLQITNSEFSKQWSKSYYKLKSGYILLSNTNLAMKSIFLNQPNVGDMSLFYENSPSKCLLCSANILEKNNLQIKNCVHSICRDCVDRFAIGNPQCMLGCISKKSYVHLNIDGYMLNISKEKLYLEMNKFLNITCKIIENCQSKLISLTELFRHLLSVDYSKVDKVNDHIKNIMQTVILLCKTHHDQDVYLYYNAFLTSRKISSFLHQKKGFVKECKCINLIKNISIYRCIMMYNKDVDEFIYDLCKFNVTNKKEDIKCLIIEKLQLFKEMCKKVRDYRFEIYMKDIPEIDKIEEPLYEALFKFVLRLVNFIINQ